MTVDLKALAAEFPRGAVSWRAQSVTKAGDKAMALAYIDARDVMERLDAVCGPAGWQCDYPHASAKTVCRIGIKLGDEWVWKANGAGDSDIEAEKGALSDAFKRAAVLWGIGRYLYTIESPWVPCETYETNGKKHWKRWTVDPWSCVRGAGPAPADFHAPDSRHLAAIDKAGDLTALETAFATAWRSTGALEDRAEFKKRYEARKTELLPAAKNLGEQLDRMAAAERIQ